MILTRVDFTPVFDPGFLLIMFLPEQDPDNRSFQCRCVAALEGKKAKV